MHDHKRPAPADAVIHDLISHRWSPRAFDSRPIEPEKLRSLFEAARWASSSYNAQPWYFIVGTKDDPEITRKSSIVSSSSIRAGRRVRPSSR